ncbi:hypothetical protein ACFCW6_18950 [Streptomyces sp. NPDC056333]|uniref:hypothetical protein n=1 Tax=Streptomyces sp. NPDC056333 TaxID=3345786 RepID=UPI0035DA4ED6
MFVHSVRPVAVGVSLPDQLPAGKIMQALRKRRQAREKTRRPVMALAPGLADFTASTCAQ